MDASEEAWAARCAQARDNAEQIAAMTATVATADREVTVTVGVGGVPLRLDLSNSARGLDNRVLARLVMSAIDHAQADLRERVEDPFDVSAAAQGDNPSLGALGADHASGIASEFQAKLDQLRAHGMRQIAMAQQLQQSLASMRSTVESPEGEVRVTVQGGRVVELEIREDEAPDGEFLLTVIRSAFTRAGAQSLEHASRITGKDLRSMMSGMGV